LSLVDFEFLLQGLRVVIGEDEAHAIGERGAQGREIVTAVLLHHELFSILAQRCAEPPERLIVILAEELSPDVELSVCVDY